MVIVVVMVVNNQLVNGCYGLMVNMHYYIIIIWLLWLIWLLVIYLVIISKTIHWVISSRMVIMVVKVYPFLMK